MRGTSLATILPEGFALYLDGVSPPPRITAVTPKSPCFPLLLTLETLPLSVCARAVADYL